LVGGSVGLWLGHGKRKKRVRLTVGFAHQRSKEGRRVAAVASRAGPREREREREK
jgi:hypothetical protein